MEIGILEVLESKFVENIFKWVGIWISNILRIYLNKTLASVFIHIISGEIQNHRVVSQFLWEVRLRKKLEMLMVSWYSITSIAKQSISLSAEKQWESKRTIKIIECTHLQNKKYFKNKLRQMNLLTTNFLKLWHSECNTFFLYFE